METEVTREELYRNLADLHRKLDIIMGVLPRFLSRRQVVAQIGRKEFDTAIRLGIIRPLKGEYDNSKMLIERSEFERYLDYRRK